MCTKSLEKNIQKIIWWFFPGFEIMSDFYFILFNFFSFFNVFQIEKIFLPKT